MEFGLKFTYCYSFLLIEVQIFVIIILFPHKYEHEINFHKIKFNLNLYLFNFTDHKWSLMKLDIFLVLIRNALMALLSKIWICASISIIIHIFYKCTVR